MDSAMSSAAAAASQQAEQKQTKPTDKAVRTKAYAGQQQRVSDRLQAFVSGLSDKHKLEIATSFLPKFHHSQSAPDQLQGPKASAEFPQTYIYSDKPSGHLVVISGEGITLKREPGTQDNTYTNIALLMLHAHFAAMFPDSDTNQKVKEFIQYLKEHNLSCGFEVLANKLCGDHVGPVDGRAAIYLLCVNKNGEADGAYPPSELIAFAEKFKLSLPAQIVVQVNSEQEKTATDELFVKHVQSCSSTASLPQGIDNFREALPDRAVSLLSRTPHGFHKPFPHEGFVLSTYRGAMKAVTNAIGSVDVYNAKVAEGAERLQSALTAQATLQSGIYERNKDPRTHHPIAEAARQVHAALEATGLLSVLEEVGFHLVKPDDVIVLKKENKKAVLAALQQQLEQGVYVGFIRDYIEALIMAEPLCQDAEWEMVKLKTMEVAGKLSIMVEIPDKLLAKMVKQDKRFAVLYRRAVTLTLSNQAAKAEAQAEVAASVPQQYPLQLHGIYKIKNPSYLLVRVLREMLNALRWKYTQGNLDKKVLCRRLEAYVGEQYKKLLTRYGYRRIHGFTEHLEAFKQLEARAVIGWLLSLAPEQVGKVDPTDDNSYGFTSLVYQFYRLSDEQWKTYAAEVQKVLSEIVEDKTEVKEERQQSWQGVVLVLDCPENAGGKKGGKKSSKKGAQAPGNKKPSELISHLTNNSPATAVFDLDDCLGKGKTPPLPIYTPQSSIILVLANPFNLEKAIIKLMQSSYPKPNVIIMDTHGGSVDRFTQKINPDEDGKVDGIHLHRHEPGQALPSIEALGLTVPESGCVKTLQCQVLTTTGGVGVGKSTLSSVLQKEDSVTVLRGEGQSNFFRDAVAQVMVGDIRRRLAMGDDVGEIRIAADKNTLPRVEIPVIGSANGFAQAFQATFNASALAALNPAGSLLNIEIQPVILWLKDANPKHTIPEGLPTSPESLVRMLGAVLKPDAERKASSTLTAEGLHSTHKALSAFMAIMSGFVRGDKVLGGKALAEYLAKTSLDIPHVSPGVTINRIHVQGVGIPTPDFSSDLKLGDKQAFIETFNRILMKKYNKEEVSPKEYDQLQALFESLWACMPTVSEQDIATSTVENAKTVIAALDALSSQSITPEASPFVDDGYWRLPIDRMTAESLYPADLQPQNMHKPSAPHITLSFPSRAEAKLHQQMTDFLMTVHQLCPDGIEAFAFVGKEAVGSDEQGAYALLVPMIKFFNQKGQEAASIEQAEEPGQSELRTFGPASGKVKAVQPVPFSAHITLFFKKQPAQARDVAMNYDGSVELPACQEIGPLVIEKSLFYNKGVQSLLEVANAKAQEGAQSPERVAAAP